MRTRTFALALVLTLMASVAQADPILYTDRAAFETALGDVSVRDFNNRADYPCVFVSRDTCQHDFGGLTWDGDHANATVSGGRFTFRVLADSNIGPSEPLRGFGFDLIGGFFQESWRDVRFSYQVADDPWVSLILRAGTFFGMTVDGAPLQMFFAPPLGGPIYPGVTIDNLTVARVPEPATILLLTTSFGLLSVARRRAAAVRRAPRPSRRV